MSSTVLCLSVLSVTTFGPALVVLLVPAGGADQWQHRGGSRLCGCSQGLPAGADNARHHEHRAASAAAGTWGAAGADRGAQGAGCCRVWEREQVWPGGVQQRPTRTSTAGRRCARSSTSYGAAGDTFQQLHSAASAVAAVNRPKGTLRALARVPQRWLVCMGNYP